MTITTTGLTGSDCMEQYGISDDMVCTGRISGLDITDNGSSINISPGSAYVKVVDASGFEMNVKVYSDTVQTVTKVAGNEIIIKVPLANVQNAQNNTDFSSIATFEVVPTGTGGDFHLVLASFNAGGTVSSVVNAGHYLPGCDFCMRCEGGDLQLPDIDVNGNAVVTGNSRFEGSMTLNNDLDLNGSAGISGDLDVVGTISGDGSGLTNIPLGSLPYMTETSQGVGEIATQSEVLSLEGNRVLTTGNVEYLFTVAPSWALINSDNGGTATNSGLFEDIKCFNFRIPGTYRIGFIVDGSSGRARVQVDGTTVLLDNIGGTVALLSGGLEFLDFGNTAYPGNETNCSVVSRCLFEDSTTGGSNPGVVYGEFGIINHNTTVCVQASNLVNIDRIEIFGTPLILSNGL